MDLLSLNIPTILKKFNKLTADILDEDESEIHYFKKKKYPEDKLEDYRKWIDHEYENNRFDKWDHGIYMQVFEWALNTNLPKDMKSKCESLVLAYMTYLITNGGDRTIPDVVKKNFIKFYKCAKIFTE